MVDNNYSRATLFLCVLVAFSGCGNDSSNKTEQASIVGAWNPGWDQTHPGMLVFYENGFYIQWQDTSQDPNCAPGGVEFGTYNYDGTTLSAVQIIVDENGECGLSNGSVRLTINGNTATSESTTLTRVDGGANSLVGAWNNGATIDAPMALVFYDSGFYMHWQNASSDPNCSPGGVEYGIYSYNSTNTVGLTATPIVDENSSCGASNLDGVTAFTVNGDTLTVVENNVSSSLNRVKAY